ncbi:LacI family DNA-binding transcriptional regulator [Algibacillus agarilyticus]|uniref:LacI family DNA-binding transcriptional regulator n=1 Tax=Algibacillus agarilyticus TaxID=2234133 RepID=UPI000DD06DA0|nr:LacI family DNA-binding transcriptional regulator [Algibacillus agarilyticus]
MVTIKDVARVAGVSTSTVSRVVRGQSKVGDQCRAHVQSVIKALGYRPNINARALVSQKSEMLGIVTPEFSSNFFGNIASGVASAARNANYKVMMSNSQDIPHTELEAIASLREHGCQNIILHSKFTDDNTLAQLAADIPGLIIINRFVSAIASRCVWIDNIAGGKMAVEHLLDKGHRQFAFITSDIQNQDPDDRLNGCRNALSKLNISVEPEQIASGLPEMEDGYRAAETLLARDINFTAVIAYNDAMAVGAMNALQDAGKKVPEDVSVIGFDNLLIATACRPYLTTMNYPIFDMACYASRLSILLTTCKEEAENKTHLFMPSLVERDSVCQVK